MRYLISLPIQRALGGSALALALALSTMTIAEISAPSQAFAGNGNGGGPGNGNGAENGHGHGHGNENGGRGLGSVSSELGKANAAHASDRARERASSHSAVGIMADYRDRMETELDTGSSLVDAHNAVAEDFSDLIDGIEGFSDEAVEALGSMLGLEAD